MSRLSEVQARKLLDVAPAEVVDESALELAFCLQVGQLRRYKEICLKRHRLKREPLDIPQVGDRQRITKLEEAYLLLLTQAREASEATERFLANLDVSIDVVSQAPVSLQIDMHQEGWNLAKIHRVSASGFAQFNITKDKSALGPTVPEIFEEYDIEDLFDVKTVSSWGNGFYLWEKSKQYSCHDGQFLAEWLIGRSRRLPTSWRCHQFLFPGTIWLNHNNVLCLPWLRFDTSYGWICQFAELRWRLVESCAILIRSAIFIR